MRADTLPIRRGMRARYAWPGGYPLSLIMTDGGILCWRCASAHKAMIVRDTRYRLKAGWDAVGWGVIWEGEHWCDHCGDLVEAAYPDT